MPNLKDLTTHRFGSLVVHGRAADRNGKTMWRCICDCGTTKDIRASHLTTRRTQSCGCFKNDKSLGKKPVLDLTGKIFDRLTVLSHDKKRSVLTGVHYWMCDCACGGSGSFHGERLRMGKVRSCGCLQTESRLIAQLKHGHTKNRTNTKEFICWQNLRSRCLKPNDASYKEYGGRGIKVCDRWQESFENFFEDMGYAPSPKHSIDRINNDGNYEPENCRWATIVEQTNNTRRNRMLTINGETNTVASWARITGIHYDCLWQRVKDGRDPLTGKRN